MCNRRLKQSNIEYIEAAVSAVTIFLGYKINLVASIHGNRGSSEKWTLKTSHR